MPQAAQGLFDKGQNALDLVLEGDPERITRSSRLLPLELPNQELYGDEE